MEQNTICLERLCEKHRDAVAEILIDKIVAKTYMVPDFKSQEQVDKLFERLVELSQGETRYVRGLCLGETLVGFLNDVGIEDGSVELGWVVHPRYHNRGYATQGVKLAVEELFAAGFARVTAGAFSENGASIRVMEKSGMSRLEQEDEIEYRGQIHHCVYYGVEKTKDA